MTDLILISAGIILLGAMLYLFSINRIYQSHNKELQISLSKCRESMKAERANSAMRIKALEDRVSKMVTLSDGSGSYGIDVEIKKSEIQILRASETYDLTEPQYKHLEEGYMRVMSRQQILKDATKFITTEVEEIRPKVFKYTHSLILFQSDEEADV